MTAPKSSAGSLKKAKAKERALAKKMLSLHLQHEMLCFNEHNFITLMKEETELLFDWVSHIPLKNLVNADQVKEVIDRNVVQASVPGAVAEIAGEAANKLFTSSQHKSTTLNAFISRTQYEEFIDKLIELKEQRINGMDKLIDLPLYGELISGVLYKSITRYIYDNNLISKKIPGVSSLLKAGRNVVNKTVPKLGSGFEDSVRSYIVSSLDFILEESKTFLSESVTDEQLKISAMELWTIIEKKPISEFQQGMDSLDLSEFVALGYEFWLHFRKTSYFKHCYETIVDYFFDKYGDVELNELLEDLAITPERVMKEIEAFAPQILQSLRESDQLESMLTRHLERFYYSDAALDCLKH